ncbi:ArpU family phage packaging/lysis transcriptional regulator [Pseudobacillus wudalianchiensis]|uniref:ArpU family transcriptional regulator n=1 Tax=Pseudobacillus wudalianchiensis TaxID=1743143 RepID=A0A1B9AN62_9BACI|nr:ArpU family phage packaging/lysis transcriptional regulator [Bacillus wudalianchiensis]OCA85245.1 ArpU family transcriptional regulator [Bacillus wudalianchiensis]
MNAIQLKFFREIDEKEVQKLIIGELRDYRALKVQIENKKEQEAAGVINLFPSVRQQDRLNELKVKQIERALENSLDFIERRIIEMKYFTSQETKDINIYMELGLKKGKYYEKKRAAIYRLATALGII